MKLNDVIEINNAYLDLHTGLFNYKTTGEASITIDGIKYKANSGIADTIICWTIQEEVNNNGNI